MFCYRDYQLTTRFNQQNEKSTSNCIFYIWKWVHLKGKNITDSLPLFARTTFRESYKQFRNHNHQWQGINYFEDHWYLYLRVVTDKGYAISIISCQTYLVSMWYYQQPKRSIWDYISSHLLYMELHFVHTCTQLLLQYFKKNVLWLKTYVSNIK